MHFSNYRYLTFTLHMYSLQLHVYMIGQDGLHTELKDVPMKDLHSELQEVTDWFTLGVYLDVPTPLLVAIRNDYTDTDQCRVEMLIAWSKQEMPTWPRVVHALGEMGMTELAIALAEKYGRIL